MTPFREGFKALGYIEGENIIIEARYAEIAFCIGDHDGRQMKRGGRIGRGLTSIGIMSCRTGSRNLV
jgi:hypothetical protein